MGVRFLIASAACSLVDFSIHLILCLRFTGIKSSGCHTRKLPTMRDGDHNSPSTMTRTTLNTNSKFQC